MGKQAYTPWSAAVNGSRTELNAVNASAQLNQNLGTHPAQFLSYGTPVVTPISGVQGYFTLTNQASSDFTTHDFAQAFTMSGTTVGRITVPIKTFGNGADLQLVLCPDASGVPNTAAPIAQVTVPAAVINATGAQQGLENADSVFQTAAFNTQFGTNFSQLVPWISPAATVNGAPSFFGVATSGNYSLLLGGYDTTATAASAACFTVQYTGGGTVAPPVPQPSLPQATWGGHVAATSDTVVFAGGINNASATVANVWTAGWDPNTGTIGAWSAQAALPQAVNNGASASWGEYVYVVGGRTTSAYTSAVSNVYMAKVTNSQLSTWSATTPLPRALALTFVGVIGNWMVVAGGNDAANTYRAETYYAAILPDGTLDSWRTGPTMPQAVSTLTSTWTTAVTTSSLIVYTGIASPTANGNYIMQLSVSPSGPAPSWNSMTANSPGQVAMSAFTDGNGQWYLMGYNLDNTAAQNYFQAVPLVSAPLYATGLTNGGTYWLVIRQIPSAAPKSDYLGLGVNDLAYPTPLQKSLSFQDSWSTFFSPFAVPLTVYNTAVTSETVHIAEDQVSGSGVYSRWGTLTYGYQGFLLGALTVTEQNNPPLNSNFSFASGTSPWTAVNGTITQSNAQTQGGFSFSGLLTPSGSGTLSYAASEVIPVQRRYPSANPWMKANGWFYSPTGWSNFQINVNWFDSSGGYLSTTSGTVTTLAANTWTQVTAYANAPAQAAAMQLVPTQSGSPGATNLLYLSNVTIQPASPYVPALTSVAQVVYDAAGLFPVGVEQLN